MDLSSEGRERSDNQGAEETFQKGLSLEDSNPSDALKTFDEVLKLKPDHVGAYHHRGLCLIALGRLEEAITSLRFAGSLDPKDSRSKVKLGLCFLVQARFIQAQELLSEVTSRDPLDPNAWSTLALAYLEPGSEKRAFVDAEKAIEIQPKNEIAKMVRTRAKALLDIVEEKDIDDRVSTTIIDEKVRVVDRQITHINVPHPKGGRLVGTMTTATIEQWSVASAPTLPRRLPMMLRSLPGKPSDPNEAGLVEAMDLLKAGLFVKALKQYEDILTRKPDDLNGWIGKGFAFHMMGKYTEAESCAEHALALSPNNPMALVAKAGARFMTARFSEALEITDKAIDIDPENTDAWYIRCASLYAQIRFRESIEAADRVLEYDPGYGNAMTAKAWNHQILNEPEQHRIWLQRSNVRNEEMEVLRRLILLAMTEVRNPCYGTPQAQEPQAIPTDAKGLVSEGKRLMKKGDIEDARKAFEEAICLDNASEDAWEGLCYSLLVLDEGDVALNACTRAKENCPNSAKIWSIGGDTLMRFGKPEEALQAYDKAIEISSADSKLLLGKARILGELERYDEALGITDHVLFHWPTEAEAWLLKGILLLKKENYTTVGSYIYRSIMLRPRNPSAWEGLAALNTTIGRAIEVIQCLDLALEMDPGKYANWIGRAGAMLMLGESAFGLSNVEKALEIEPGSVNALAVKGGILWSLGKDEDALGCFEAALVLDDLHVTSLLGRGAILLRHRKSKDAFTVFEKALSLEPGLQMAIEGRIGALAMSGMQQEAYKALTEASIPRNSWGMFFDPSRSSLSYQLWIALRRRLSLEWLEVWAD